MNMLAREELNAQNVALIHLNRGRTVIISKDKIQEILKKKQIDLEKIAADPRVYDKACSIAYKSIPIPWRWFVGKKRVGKIVNKLKEQLS